MPRVDAEVRGAVVGRLSTFQAQGRQITEMVRFVAQSLAVGERTVWRWLEEGPPGSREDEAWKLNAAAVRALYNSGARRKRAWQQLQEDGVDVPSYPTFCRAVKRDLSRAELAYMSAGEAGRRRYSVYRRWEPEDRNDVWEADHAQLDLLVSVPRWRDPVRPWLTVLIDGYSRVLMGWVLSVQPSTREVLTAIREGIFVDEARGPWGGVPDLIRFDGGREFLAEAVTQSANRLGFAGLPTAPYSPHKKGKVERLHQTIGEGLVAGLPHYLHGARKANGKLYAQPSMLTFKQLQEAVTVFVDKYNNHHQHRSLGGLTPAQKWATSSRVLDVVGAKQLWWMLLAETSRTVGKDGIHFPGADYPFIAPELVGHGGEKVEVRHMPHDRRSIEVFQDGRWLCTAYPQDKASAELAAEFQQQQGKLNREMGARRAAATRERSRRLAPVTATSGIEELPARKSAKRRPPELSNARIDAVLRLHGLHDRLNTALPPKADESDA
jgi:putative transposase